MSEIHINNIFPTPIMRVEKLLDEKTIKNLVEKIRHTHTEANVKTDLLSHTQPINPKQDEDYAYIAEKAAPFIRDFGFLLFGENLHWTVKEMWMNLLNAGGHQMLHSHANSFISCVVYLTDCDTSARTVFHKPMGANQFVFSNHHRDSATTAYNAEKWVAADIRCGDMILFPSYLLHAVPQNEGGERITIALNALPDKLKSWDYEVEFSNE